MSRAAPTIPVSAKMYRHFAVVTVTITVCLAIFADGENREAIAQNMAERQQENELLRAEQEKSGKGARQLFQDKRKNKGTFGPDSGGARSMGVSQSGYDPYGSIGPELVAGDAVQFVPVSSASAATAAALPAKPPPGMTIEEWLALQKQGALPENEQPGGMTQNQQERFHRDAIESVNTPSF